MGSTGYLVLLFAQCSQVGSGPRAWVHPTRAQQKVTFHTLLLGEPPVAVSAYLVRLQDSYLVDSASSHMLVSKIKPCKFCSPQNKSSLLTSHLRHV